MKLSTAYWIGFVCATLFWWLFFWSLHV